MSPKEICTKLSLWIVNIYLKSYIFCFHFTLYLHVWIRIRIPKAPEYGSNTNQDPQHFSGLLKYPRHRLKIVFVICLKVKKLESSASVPAKKTRLRNTQRSPRLV